jgi:hypothetical protein
VWLPWPLAVSGFAGGNIRLGSWRLSYNRCLVLGFLGGGQGLSNIATGGKFWSASYFFVEDHLYKDYWSNIFRLNYYIFNFLQF